MGGKTGEIWKFMDTNRQKKHDHLVALDNVGKAKSLLRSGGGKCENRIQISVG